jgi:hypothetical protein
LDEGVEENDDEAEGAIAPFGAVSLAQNQPIVLCSKSASQVGVWKI